MAIERTARSLTVYVIAACFVLIVPIAIVIALAFGDQGTLRFPPTAFSLRWFKAFFADPRWQKALLSSLAIASIACVVATVLGFFAAYAFVRSDLRAKKLLLTPQLVVRESTQRHDGVGWSDKSVRPTRGHGTNW